MECPQIQWFIIYVPSQRLPSQRLPSILMINFHFQTTPKVDLVDVHHARPCPFCRLHVHYKLKPPFYHIFSVGLQFTSVKFYHIFFGWPTIYLSQIRKRSSFPTCFILIHHVWWSNPSSSDHRPSCTTVSRTIRPGLSWVIIWTWQRLARARYGGIQPVVPPIFDYENTMGINGLTFNNKFISNIWFDTFLKLSLVS